MCAIEVKHGVSPGLVAGASYAAGMMRGTQRIGAEAAQYLSRSLDRRQQQEIERMRLASQSERDQWLANKDQRQQDYNLYRDFLKDDRQFERELKRDELISGREEERDIRTLKRQTDLQYLAGQQRIDTDIWEGIRKGELELAPEAQQQMAQLDDTEAQLATDNRLTEEQRDYARDEISSRRSALLRSARRPRNLSMPVQEQVKQVLGENYDKYSDLPWTVNKEGELMLPRGFSMPKQEEKTIPLGNGNAMPETEYKASMDRFELDLKQQDKWDKRHDAIKAMGRTETDAKGNVRDLEISEEEIVKQIGPRPEATPPWDKKSETQDVGKIEQEMTVLMRKAKSIDALSKEDRAKFMELMQKRADLLRKQLPASEVPQPW
jgi:hypothetical protein